MLNTQRIVIAAAVVVLVPIAACTNEVDQGNVMNAGVVLSSDETQALTSKCAAGSTVKGIDVSYYQGSINWAAVKNDGVKYAFIRVSDGTGYRDSKFDANWSGAKTHGVLRGAYQFFRSDEDPETQADILINKVGGHLGPNDLPPVIDVESSDGQSAATIKSKVKRWLDRIHDKLGVNGIVYTGPYFWQDSVGNADLSSHPLWVAHYGTNCPLVPGAWHRWSFHQYTSSGHVDGISGSVDMNHFNGTLAQLQDLEAGPDLPHACVTGHFHGAFCDDDGKGGEDEHNRLKNQLDVNFHCRDIAGHPAFCGGAEVDRSQAIWVLGKAAKMPVNGSPNAFRDDNDDAHEKYLNAAKEFGIYVGDGHGHVNPDGNVDRDMLAVILYRMYRLQDVQHDYFFDDDGHGDEHIHNAVAAAGLMTGYADDHHTRNKFDGNGKATRTSLAVVAVRAHDQELVPVWNIPDACLSGNFSGPYCDDDTGGADDADTRLHDELGVDFSCGKLAGSPAFCPARKATRAQTAFVLEAAAGVPLAGHNDAFTDDDGDKLEKYLNAAQDYGIMVGYSGATVKPSDIANRNTLSVVLKRMYNLPPTAIDYFSDDDGNPNEDAHNRCAEAGLFTGYDDGNGGRRFLGEHDATRSMLATLALRAHDNPLLVPVWLAP